MHYANAIIGNSEHLKQSAVASEKSVSDSSSLVPTPASTSHNSISGKLDHILG